MKAYLAIHSITLLFQFKIYHFAYFIMKKSIKPWENIHDLKVVGIQLYQSAFRLGFSGLMLQQLFQIGQSRLLGTLNP